MSDLSERHAHEALYQTLDSPGWRLVLDHLVGEMRALARALIENPDLGEAQRRGYVYALNHLKRGVEATYSKAGRSLPEWLSKELYFYRDDNN